MIGLTAKQHECFSFISSFIMESGVSPTIRQIEAGVGGGLSVAHRMVTELERLGFIRRHKNGRVIEVVQQSVCCPNCGHEVSIHAAPSTEKGARDNG